MRALHTAMMKNGGMDRMHSGMHGRMGGTQHGRATPDAR
jgi:hypothetical protein